MMMENGNFFGKKMFYAPHGFLIDYENKELLEQFTKEIGILSTYHGNDDRLCCAKL